MIPVLLRLKIREEGSRGVNLYIPLPLLYLLLLPLAAIAAVVLLVWLVFRGHSLKLFPALFLLLCALKGTEVEYSDRDTDVILKIL